MDSGFDDYRRWFVSIGPNSWFPFSEVGFNAVGVDAAVAWSRTARVDAKCLKSAPEPTHWPDLEPSSENGRVAITTIETTPLRYRLTLRSTRRPQAGVEHAARSKRSPHNCRI